MEKMYFTSESVTSGHPDKVCDLIADSILDEAMRQDPYSHMAVEATIKDDLILVYGEAGTKAKIDYEAIAKNVMKEIGYNEEYHVTVKVNTQSAEINSAVAHDQISAGDQGIMFGYASDETDDYMPFAIDCAHKLAKKLEEVRRTDDRLCPDGKTQVTAEYIDGKLQRIDTIVVSTQHTKNITQPELHDLIIEKVIKPTVDPKLIDENTKYLINPSGSFILGGSWGDSGTTGRKIVVDSYGGYAPIGGGCFSSKDPTKVDRSAAYYARYVCRNLVANGLCHKCQLQLSYAIGEPKPLSVNIDTFGTSKYTNEQLLDIIEKNFDFSVANIIKELDLRRPIYTQTTNYGHFGKENLPWEQFKKLELN
ncbi:MAG: methionine adenosyltransferase [Solobacterium sp.]|jgi:S-adenosylmethionine synthetase|nr:methionine adenosyltransferase [Solobacterium sp.]MCH4221986.1 methionine adenosyltransferase [Solobacterium sp.]MCH4266099.1 methionine adenosyltransferase [Solobacterium sp.]